MNLRNKWARYKLYGKGLVVTKKDLDAVQTPADESKKAFPARQLHDLSWSLVVASVLTTASLLGLEQHNRRRCLTSHRRSVFGSVNRLPWLSVAFFVSAVGTTLFW